MIAHRGCEAISILKSITIILLTLSSFPLAALAGTVQLPQNDPGITWDDRRGVVKVLSGRLTQPSNQSDAGMATEFLNRYRTLLGIRDPARELEIRSSYSTPEGHFIRFRQKKDGLDVIGGEVIVRIYKGMLKTIVNYFEPDIPVSTVPVISRDEAVVIASNGTGIHENAHDIALVIFPWDKRFHLAFRIDFPYNDSPGPSKYRVFVDAINGSVILIENRLMHNGPAKGTGIGVDGVSKTFNAYETGGKFYLGNIPILGSETKILTFTADKTKTLPGTIMNDMDNSWDDPAAVDAHFYGNYVFEYYKNRFPGSFSWFYNSGLGRSGGLLSTVHYGTFYENAFWDGEQMVYGDGGFLFHPLSGSLDIVAHEFTHAVTEAISNLIYCNEPGALSESWSDVMAMFASIDYGDDLPYQLAEEVMKIDESGRYKGFYAMRRMDDPPFRTDGYPENDYNPSDPLSGWGQPEHTSEQYHSFCLPWNDNGGVHINSGIPNKAAYLITRSIGAKKAEQIYYYAMFYLSPLSGFMDARDATEQAAIDLFGTGAEFSAVQNAFDAVGIP